MSKTSGMKRKSSNSGESTAEKKMKILTETDSMMEKVFSINEVIQSILSHLPIQDLVNVARVSHAMKLNADFVFKKYHNATIKIEYDEENFAEQQMVFRQFGSLTRKLEIDMSNVDEDEDIFSDDANVVLRTVGHFCGVNLEDLTLRGMKIDLSSPDFDDANDRADFRKLLGTLTKLSLVGVCIKSGFFRWATSIQELEIHSSCHMETLPEVVTLPQLKILSIGACPSWPLMPGCCFNRFLRANRSIEQVNYHFIIIGEGHLESICSLPNLTHLKLIFLECDVDDFPIIANARKLKKLSIHAPNEEHRGFKKLQKILPKGCDFAIHSLNIEHEHDDDDDDRRHA